VSVSYYGEFNQRKPEGIWHFLNRLLILLIVLAFITGIICSFLPALHKMRDQADRTEDLKKELDAQNAIYAQRTREVGLLKNDPDYVAVLARDRLDMMKDNETIFRLEPQATPVPLKSSAHSR
jgi:cell division protein FtsB